jgi:cell division protein FtsN
MSMRSLLSIAAAMALAGPVLACLNDTESLKHEREFKSQYRESQYQPPQPEQVSSTRPYLMGGAGVLMAVAGGALFFRLRSQLR